jgi:hypothetical protein
VVKAWLRFFMNGHRGFSDLAEHVKAFFVKESQTRQEYSRELQRAAGPPNEEGGTARGVIHRIWGDIRQIWAAETIHFSINRKIKNKICGADDLEGLGSGVTVWLTFGHCCLAVTR